MPTSIHMNFNLVRSDISHNWAVLKERKKLENFHRLITLEISDEDAQNGQGGKVGSCAAALCAKEHWGPHCKASVKAGRDGQVLLSISNYDDDQRTADERYVMELGIIMLPGAFDPEGYDANRKAGLPVRGGLVLIRSVRIERARNNQPKRINQQPRTDPKTRAPRKWPKSIPLKGQNAPRKEVMDILEGKTQSYLTDIFK